MQAAVETETGPKSTVGLGLLRERTQETIQGAAGAAWTKQSQCVTRYFLASTNEYNYWLSIIPYLGEL